MSKITPEELAERARATANALSTVKMEGLQPSPEAAAIFERYAGGQLSLVEMGDSIDALHDQKYGPLRLPRDERSKKSA